MDVGYSQVCFYSNVNDNRSLQRWNEQWVSSSSLEVFKQTDIYWDPCGRYSWTKLNLMTSSEIPLLTPGVLGTSYQWFIPGNHSGKPGCVGLHREGRITMLATCFQATLLEQLGGYHWDTKYNFWKWHYKKWLQICVFWKWLWFLERAKNLIDMGSSYWTIPFGNLKKKSNSRGMTTKGCGWFSWHAHKLNMKYERFSPSGTLKMCAATEALREAAPIRVSTFWSDFSKINLTFYSYGAHSILVRDWRVYFLW